MIKKILFILLFPVLIFTACSDSHDDDNEQAVTYYSINNSEKLLIQSGDIISVFADDYIVFYIDPSESCPLILTDDSVKLVDNGNGIYVCRASGVFESHVIFIFGEGDDAVTLYFYIHSQQKDPTPEPEEPGTLYYIIDSETAINVEDESLKGAIQSDIDNDYTPSFFSIKFIYTTPRSGEVKIFYKSTGETVNGLFNENESGINVTYNNKEYHYYFEHIGPGVEVCTMTQNLTDIFKIKYPLETINEILVVTTVLKYDF